MNTTTEISVKEFVKKLFPDENIFAYETKKGKWEIGYTNDYPMQHGDGEKITLSWKILSRLIALSAPSPTVEGEALTSEKIMRMFKLHDGSLSNFKAVDVEVMLDMALASKSSPSKVEGERLTAKEWFDKNSSPYDERFGDSVMALPEDKFLEYAAQFTTSPATQIPNIDNEPVADLEMQLWRKHSTPHVAWRKERVLMSLEEFINALKEYRSATQEVPEGADKAAEDYSDRKSIDRWVCTPANIKRNAKDDFLAGVQYTTRLAPAAEVKEEAAVNEFINQLFEWLHKLGSYNVEYDIDGSESSPEEAIARWIHDKISNAEE